MLSRSARPVEPGLATQGVCDMSGRNQLNKNAVRIARWGGAAGNHRAERGLPQQSGVTLLEVMVTVVILSMGLLGLAALQMTGLKNNRDAYNIATAGQVAQDIAERMRSDLLGIRGNSYDSLNDEHALSADAGKCDDASNNTLTRFKDSVACQLAALPEGSALVSEIAGGSNTFYIAVTWADPQLIGNGWAGVEATSACGDAVAGTRCYYTVFMP
jgi:type IV pilus assembly protein PilV